MAITAVILYHMISFRDATGAAGRLANAVFQSLWVGVDLFFVLSGFLITGILLNTRMRPAYFRRFYLRRSLRIFPLYYVVVLTGFALAIARAVPDNLGIPVTLKTYVPLLTYSTNCFTFDGQYEKFGSFFVFWSLAVEEHFYLAWPLVVYVCSPRKIAFVCLAACVLAAAVRAGFWAAHISPMAIYDFTLCRFDALAMGALTNLVVRRYLHAAHFRIWAIGVAVLALIGLVFIVLNDPRHTLNYASKSVQLVGFPVIAVLMAAIVAIAVAAGPRNLVTSLCGASPLRHIGKYSYGLYVWHPFVLNWANAHLAAATLSAHVGSHALASLIRWTVSLLLTMGLALLSWTLLEQPLIRLKDVLAPETPVEQDVVALSMHGVA